MKLKPLRDDILVYSRPERDVEKSVIYYKDDTSNKKTQFFIIHAVGPDVVDVRVGDTVVIPWSRITPPQNMTLEDGIERQYGVTSEKEVLAIID